MSQLPTAQPAARATIGATIAGLADLAAFLRECGDLPEFRPSFGGLGGGVLYSAGFHERRGEEKAVTRFARAASAIGAPIRKDPIQTGGGFYRASRKFQGGVALELWCPYDAADMAWSEGVEEAAAAG